MFSDAIAHIIALQRSPACFKAPFNKWYPEINSLTYQIGNLTSQPKEEIVQFLQQKVYSNLADLLTKFDLEQDSVDDWMLKSKQLFEPDWLQNHPNTYLKQLLKLSNDQLSLQAAGGLQHEQIFKITENTPDLLAPAFVHRNQVKVTNTCCYIKYVMANDKIPTKTSPKNPNYELIVPLFHKYRFYDGSIPLRILGRVILFCHAL